MKTMLIAALLVCILVAQPFLFAPSVTAVEGPLYGGTLVIGQTFDTKNFVQIFELAGAWFSSFALYDRLVEVDLAGGVHPGLAKSWEISDDGVTYTFYLYDNVTWHDGAKFTSADVKFTFEEIKRLKGVGLPYVIGINNIETPGDYTVVITLETPDSAFLTKMGDWGGKDHIIAKHIYEGTDWKENPATYKPIGTGPFKFVELVSSDHYTLEANDAYFQGRPYLDKLVFKIIPDRTAEQMALEAGEIGFMLDPPPLSEVARLSNTPGIAVKLIPQLEDEISFVANSHREPFDDLKVRKALAHAIDKEAINNIALAGYCHPADVVYTTEYVKLKWATNPEAKFPEYNPELAEQLLDEAGYPRGADGIRFHTTLNTLTIYREMEHVMLLVKEDLQSIGISATATLLEYGTYFAEVWFGRNFDLTITIHHSGPDPYIMGDMFMTGMWRNLNDYSNPAFDELLNKAIVPKDNAERAEFYHEAWEILANDLPYVQLTTYIRTFPYRSEYHGFDVEEPNRGGQWKFNKVWWEGAASPEDQPAAFPSEYVVVVAVVIIAIVIAGAAWAIKRKKPA